MHVCGKSRIRSGGLGAFPYETFAILIDFILPLSMTFFGFVDIFYVKSPLFQFHIV